jgi:flagellar basal-body rod protein FlgC
MGLFNIFDISSAGMDVQQARLEVAASNLANSNTTHAVDGKVYQPLEVVIGNAVSGAPSTDAALLANALPRPVVEEVTTSSVAPRLVYNPGHPDADARGFVSMPGVDPVNTMMDLVEIARSYEANLRAFDVTRSLLQRTLEIGSKR